MRYRLWTLLMQIAFGRKFEGLEICARAFRYQDDAREGLCAYCQQERKLVEALGPLGLGGVFVCRECATACVAVVRW